MLQSTRPRWQTWLSRVFVSAAIIGSVIWYVFLRDIPVLPDKDRKPDPPPVRTPVEDFRASWNSGDAADWRVTEYLARFSLSAYGDLPDVRQTANALGINEVHKIDKHPMMAFVAWTSDVMVIVFRGTDFDQIEDWIIDCNCFSPDPTEGGGIHAGFNQAYATMKNDIRDLLREANPKYIWVTGHSLGGALAAVCAYDLNSSNSKYPAGLMTFGQPMIATLQLANNLHKKLDGRFVHFANREDPFPRLPSFSYRHFGSLAMFTDTGIMRLGGVYQAKRDDQPASTQAAERNDIQPLSPDELRELQERIRQEKKMKRSPPDGKVQVTIPALSAHPMELYVENVRRWVINGGKAGDKIAPATGLIPRGK